MMRAFLFASLFVLALYAGQGHAVNNPDVMCDGSVTIGDIGDVIAAFGATGVKQELCPGSGHYDGECVDFFLSHGIEFKQSIEWLQDQLELGCRA